MPLVTCRSVPDYLTLALCISIGTGVPWLAAIYSDTNARLLISNSLSSLIGTVAAAVLFTWISPAYGLVALLVLGPAIAWLAMAAGQALKRAIAARILRSPP